MSAIERHKETLYLLFSPACAPYAETAAYFLARKGDAKAGWQLRLGLHLDLTNTTCHLIIPAGSRSADRVTLTGKSAVARYMTHEFATTNGKALYGGLPLDTQGHIDKWIDFSRSCVFATATSDWVRRPIERLESPRENRLSMDGKGLTLADLIAWDLARQHAGGKSKSVDQWVATMDRIPEVARAVKAVDETLATANLLDEIRYSIASQLSTITGVPTAMILPLFENRQPKDSQGGDFVMAVPRLKIAGNPFEKAKELQAKFVVDGNVISKVKANGIFLRFHMNHDNFRDKLIPKVLREGSAFGRNSLGFGKIAVVEYSSPDIARPFHFGHLRSIVFGNFVEKILNASGWATVSINYFGNWGKGCGLLAIGFEKFGREESLVKDPIGHLYEVFKDNFRDESVDEKARAYFARMEEGDKKALGLWQRLTDLTISKYRESYKRVNVSFDVYSSEAEYSTIHMRGVVDKLEELNLLTLSDGAQIIDLNEHKLHAAVIERSGTGGMLYISRHIAAAIDRERMYKFDNMYYVIGSQQEHHFKQLFKILELLGLPWAGKCQHIGFGMIKHKFMITPTSRVLLLEELLNWMQKSMLEVMKKNKLKYNDIDDPMMVADQVGMAAVTIEYLRSRRVKGYVFDWERMQAFDHGDTGPYLQYAHARLCSVERTAPVEASPKTNLRMLTEPSAIALLVVIAAYPDVLREASISLEPCKIVTYAFRLAHAVMVALENLFVLHQPAEIAEARLAMFKAARITLGNALATLGVVALQRM